MELNTLSPAPGSKQNPKRRGRGIGSGLGKTAGRGHKGLKSRTGGKVAAGFEGGQTPLARRLPKFGFNSRKALTSAEIRLSELGKVEGEVVSLTSLKAANLINNTIDSVKVILSGKVERSFTLQGVKATKGAKAAIEAAGGKVED